MFTVGISYKMISVRNVIIWKKPVILQDVTSIKSLE